MSSVAYGTRTAYARVLRWWYQDASARRVRTGGRWSAVAAAAVLGGWLGLVLFGSAGTSVGPLEARLSLRPATTGDTRVDIPPLGSLTLDTHDGPLRLRIDVERINPSDAQRIVANTALLEDLQEQAAAELADATLRLVVHSVLATVLGAGLACLVVLRRPRRAAVGAGLALVFLLASAGTAVATWSPRAIASPTYEGLLAIAPSLVGDAEDISRNFGLYQAQLGKIITNVSQLYDVASGLPAYTPSEDTVRVLFVSDLHLSPTAFGVMQSVATQFQTDFVIDAGDLTDHGSSTEDRYADQIPTMGQPYVFVRGNHDSLGSERAVERQPNAIVLRDGQVTSLEGLTIMGAGDPRFTPDKTTREDGSSPSAAIESAGAALAASARAAVAADSPPDIVLTHDPTMARASDGTAPLLLAGHTHKRATEALDGGSRLFTQGSTGAAGLRGLEGEDPTSVELSVLYFDRGTGALQAWDDLTVGGLGLTSAQIQRNYPDPPVVGSPAVGASPSAGP